jgi:hypothetical protein
MGNTMKKQFLALGFILLGFMPLAATTVSVLVIETGRPSATVLGPAASVWESGVMDAFFDAGYIVINVPTLRLKEVPRSGLPREARVEFETAQREGSDLFVVVHLSYSGSSQNPLNNNPFNIEKQVKTVFMAVFDVFTGELLFETSIGVNNMKNPIEEFRVAKQNMGNIIRQLKG